LAFNKWIRESDRLDGVADFDLALRDPERLTQMLPEYDCGDGLHPSDIGYCRMGDVVDLALLD
jgi:lysophospholipase L1-like esterase